MRQKTFLRLFAAIILGLFPIRLFAASPFTLYSQARVPKKPRIVTRIEPGDHSQAAQDSCKDPTQIKNAFKRRHHQRDQTPREIQER